MRLRNPFKINLSDMSSLQYQMEGAFWTMFAFLVIGFLLKTMVLAEIWINFKNYCPLLIK